MLKKYLKYHEIDFTEINIEESNKSDSFISQIKYVPVIKFNSYTISGLDITKINKLFNIPNCKHSSVYLDHASTTKIKKEVLDEMDPYFKKYFSNPSSIYSISCKTKSAIENARLEVAKFLNCDTNEIYFTSGGSEANNTAIKGIAFANINKGNHIITSVIEHKSILNTCKFLEKIGFEITYLPVDKYGKISLNQLKKSITNDTILISIMYANNEIGTIQDINEISKIAKKNNIYFHTDAVQAIGKLHIDLKNSNIDILSLSAHKFYGPKGIGAIYLKSNVSIEPLIHGGGQENNVRSGTENIPYIVGLGKAIKIISQNKKAGYKVKELTNYFISQLQYNIKGVKINGHIVDNLPGYINVTFTKLNTIDIDTFKFMLDCNNIYVSSGSACNELALEQSHVLKSIGLSDNDIKNTIRFTIGEENSKEDIDYTIEIINKILLI